MGLSVNDGQWYYVVVMWESVGGIWYLYKDGVKIRSFVEFFQQGDVISGGGVLIFGEE